MEEPHAGTGLMVCGGGTIQFGFVIVQGVLLKKGLHWMYVCGCVSREATCTKRT
jgi:hypothetical protein